MLHRGRGAHVVAEFVESIHRDPVMLSQNERVEPVERPEPQLGALFLCHLDHPPLRPAAPHQLLTPWSATGPHGTDAPPS